MFKTFKSVQSAMSYLKNNEIRTPDSLDNIEYFLKKKSIYSDKDHKFVIIIDEYGLL